MPELNNNNKTRVPATSLGACCAFILAAIGVEIALAQGPAHTSPSAASVERGFNARPEFAEETFNGLYPSLEVMFDHHDNVFRRPEPEERSDTVVTIRPALLYRANLGRHEAQLRYSANIERYDEFSSEDTTDHGVSGIIKFDVTYKLDLDVFAEFLEAHEPRGTSASRLIPVEELASGPDEFELTRYGAELTYGRRESMFQLLVGVTADEFRFTNNEQDGRDRDEDQLHATLYYNLSPRTSLFLRSTFDDIDFRSPGSDLDNEETGYFLGARWEASAATTGEVGIGRVEKDFDSPARGEDDTSSYFGRIVWQPKPFSTVKIYASKTFEETTDLESDFIDSRLIGASWDHALTDRWALFLYWNETRDKFSGGRRDELHDYGLGLDYAFRSWLTFGAGYGMFERDSNLAEAEFEDRILSLYLRLRFFVGRNDF
ncbi:MAG: outer membrane beta-barrel protein [Gammaproteobacteria bacterium]|nr:outer membrane beta-barrel protein [Gammaproteobacteria bacterium]